MRFILCDKKFLTIKKVGIRLFTAIPGRVWKDEKTCI